MLVNRPDLLVSMSSPSIFGDIDSKFKSNASLDFSWKLSQLNGNVPTEHKTDTSILSAALSRKIASPALTESSSEIGTIE